MKRVDGWEEVFHIYVGVETEKPFSWEENNCLALLYGHLNCMYGGFEPPIVASFSDEKSAKRALRDLKVKTLADAISKHLEEVHPMFSQRGDVGVIDNGILICVGSVFVGRGPYGRVVRSINEIQRAFKI